MTEREATAGRQWSLVAAALALYVSLGGMTSLLGWVADLRRLTDWNNTGISIQPNTTLAVTFAGASLLSLIAGYRFAAATLGALVAGIGATVIFQYVSGIDLGIDTLLMFERTWGRVGVVSPGRMGLPGATSWTLIGCGLMLASGSGRGRAVAPYLALMTAAISALSIVGYLSGASALYTIPTLTVIAFQTATFIVAISVSLLLAIPEHGPMRLLGDAGPAGILVRRVVPGLILLPIAVGFFHLAGQRAGLYDLAFGTAARTVLEIILLLALLWWTARAISRQAHARTRAEEGAAETNAQLRAHRQQLEADLEMTVLLHELSTAIVRENDSQTLHDKLLDAAVRVARSQFASIQILQTDPASGETGLRLLAFRGFSASAQHSWHWVSSDSVTTFGQALQTHARVIIEDIHTSPVLAGSADYAVCQETGIRSLQATPLLSRDGTVLGVISTYWSEPHVASERELRFLDLLGRQAADLIERIKNQDALREADRRKDNFLVTLAHELRNPLAPVRSSVDLLKRKTLVDPDLSKARDVLDRNTSLMSRLVDDLLDVERITRDRLELRRQRTDLGTVVRAAVEMSAPLSERFGHTVRVDLFSETLTLDADPERLGQVIGNVINNACRYTEPGGQIWVSTHREGADAVVTVRDNGIGIAPDNRSRIFELFSQVDSSMERSQGGLGIGLHLAKRLSEMHGGSISVESDGPGQGSVFTIRCPIAVAVDAVTPEESATPDVFRMARRVLVVDDNVDAAEMLATVLQLNRHETQLAHDGPSALVVAESFCPDAVLLDIGLPIMSGVEVCRRIREQPWGRKMVLVAVTGWGQDSDRRRSQEAGFDHHLVKPVNHDAVLQLLHSIPNRSEA